MYYTIINTQKTLNKGEKMYVELHYGTDTTQFVSVKAFLKDIGSKSIGMNDTFTWGNQSYTVYDLTVIQDEYNELWLKVYAR